MMLLEFDGQSADDGVGIPIASSPKTNRSAANRLESLLLMNTRRVNSNAGVSSRTSQLGRIQLLSRLDGPGN
jgi:hypothetical protein